MCVCACHFEISFLLLQCPCEISPFPLAQFAVKAPRNAVKTHNFQMASPISSPRKLYPSEPYWELVGNLICREPGSLLGSLSDLEPLLEAKDLKLSAVEEKSVETCRQWQALWTQRQLPARFRRVICMFSGGFAWSPNFLATALDNLRIVSVLCLGLEIASIATSMKSRPHCTHNEIAAIQHQSAHHNRRDPLHCINSTIIHNQSFSSYIPFGSPRCYCRTRNTHRQPAKWHKNRWYILTFLVVVQN